MSATNSPPTSEPSGVWHVDEQTRQLLPKYLRIMVADSSLDPKHRIAAARTLVEMNGQSEDIARRRAGTDAPEQPAIRIELTTEGAAALRAGFLARLAAAGDAGPAR